MQFSVEILLHQFLRFGSPFPSNIADNYSHVQYLRNPSVFSMYLTHLKVTEREKYLKGLETAAPG